MKQRSTLSSETFDYYKVSRIKTGTDTKYRSMEQNREPRNSKPIVN